MRTSLILTGTALSCVAALNVWSCGGSTNPTTDGGGGTDAPHDTTTLDVSNKDVVSSDAPSDTTIPPDASTTGEPPPPPDGGTPTTNVYTFAINTVYLGEAPRGGAPSSNAWKNYGYDIDGLVTSSSSINVCTLAAGAPPSNQDDGYLGIDNAWGSLLLPIVQTAASLTIPSFVESAYIDNGGWTLEVQVAGLSDDPAQSALGLTSQIFVGGQYSGTPAFDTTTDWPVLTTSVKDGATVASGSTVQFGSSYVNGGTFVSGTSTNPVVLQFSAGGVSLPITIHDAVLTFDHTSHGVAANGTISGVLDTTEFITGLKSVAGHISTSLCGSAFDGIAQQIRQAQDILTDGTNTSGTPCTAISIGLGFDAVIIHNPTTVQVPPSPSPDPCGD